jgi:hypothetical protein
MDTTYTLRSTVNRTTHTTDLHIPTTPKQSRNLELRRRRQQASVARMGKNLKTSPGSSKQSPCTLRHYAREFDAARRAFNSTYYKKSKGLSFTTEEKFGVTTLNHILFDELGNINPNLVKFIEQNKNSTAATPAARGNKISQLLESYLVHTDRRSLRDALKGFIDTNSTASQSKPRGKAAASHALHISKKTRTLIKRILVDFVDTRMQGTTVAPVTRSNARDYVVSQLPDLENISIRFIGRLMREAGLTIVNVKARRGRSRKPVHAFYRSLVFLTKLDTIMREVQNGEAILIYGDESYAHTSDIQRTTWGRDGANEATYAPEAKGKLLCVANIMSKFGVVGLYNNGVITKSTFDDVNSPLATCEFMFSGDKNSKDHHGVFNGQLLAKYIQNRVGPALQACFPEACEGSDSELKIYYMVDNAPYHVGKGNEASKLFLNADGSLMNRKELLTLLKSNCCTSLRYEVKVGDEMQTVQWDVDAILLLMEQHAGGAVAKDDDVHFQEEKNIAAELIEITKKINMLETSIGTLKVQCYRKIARHAREQAYEKRLSESMPLAKKKEKGVTGRLLREKSQKYVQDAKNQLAVDKAMKEQQVNEAKEEKKTLKKKYDHAVEKRKKIIREAIPTMSSLRAAAREYFVDNHPHKFATVLEEALKTTNCNIEVLYNIPNNPDSNPIEMMWAQAKGYVRLQTAIGRSLDVLATQFQDGTYTDNATTTKQKGGAFVLDPPKKKTHVRNGPFKLHIDKCTAACKLIGSSIDKTNKNLIANQHTRPWKNSGNDCKLDFSEFFTGSVRGLEKIGNDGLHFLDESLREEICGITNYAQMMLWIERSVNKVLPSLAEDENEGADFDEEDENSRLEMDREDDFDEGFEEEEQMEEDEEADVHDEEEEE